MVRCDPERYATARQPRSRFVRIPVKPITRSVDFAGPVFTRIRGENRLDGRRGFAAKSSPRIDRRGGAEHQAQPHRSSSANPLRPKSLATTVIDGDARGVAGRPSRRAAPAAGELDGGRRGAAPDEL